MGGDSLRDGGRGETAKGVSRWRGCPHQNQAGGGLGLGCLHAGPGPALQMAPVPQPPGRTGPRGSVLVPEAGGAGGTLGWGHGVNG